MALDIAWIDPMTTLFNNNFEKTVTCVLHCCHWIYAQHHWLIRSSMAGNIGLYGHSIGIHSLVETRVFNGIKSFFYTVNISMNSGIFGIRFY